MEDKNNLESREQSEMYKEWDEQHRRGRFFAGLFIVGAGILFLAREMGVVLPEWIFTWQMILITLGIFSGLKHRFRHVGWVIMVAIGGAFMAREYLPQYDFSHYIWPALIILVGLFIMLKPKKRGMMCGRRRRYSRWQQRYAEDAGLASSNEEYIDASAVFGGIKKNIVSKNFRGGEINCVFGGAEINFMQADFQDTIELEVNAVFGGAGLIIPPHWEIKSEMTAVLGGVEDKRPLNTGTVSQGKKLILKGTAVFGGIEIKSY
jgi:hypothetical protein